MVYVFSTGYMGLMPGSFPLLLSVCFVLFVFFAAGKSGDDDFAAT